MNSSQMMITLAAMMLLAIVILRVNNSFLSTSDLLLQSKYNVIAISLATSIVEEANSKAFDQNTDSSAVTSLGSLTVPGLLGPELSEFRAIYNDFDDFNNFSVVDTFVVDSLILGVFNIDCDVDYVTTGDPNTPNLNATWHKRLNVRVSSQGMNDTVTMSTIYSYWYFR